VREAASSSGTGPAATSRGLVPSEAAADGTPIRYAAREPAHRDARRTAENGTMVEGMAALHVTEAELAGNLRGFPDQVRQGDEIVVEQENRPVAILKPVADAPRTMSEIIAAMEAGGTCGFVDEDFARDVERGIESRSEPWNPPAWD
jgi:antitoxin (DNA-binding transcriptional repressor) of toxin-antitoxin stability system